MFFFYHDDTDGHTDPCGSMDDPVVLFGVYNFPHQHHRLTSAERETQEKRELLSQSERTSSSTLDF